MKRKSALPNHSHNHPSSSMEHSESTDDDRHQKIKDVVGDRTTQLLNAHPDFSFDPARIARANRRAEILEQENWTWSPLVSRRNWIWFLRRFRIIQDIRPSLDLLLSMIGFCYEMTPTRTAVVKTLGSSLLLFLSLLAGGLSMILYTSHIALLWSFREACLLAVQLAMFLLDWKEVEKYCPSILQSTCRQLLGLCQWLDHHLFLAKRYAGREWNQDDFDFTNARTASSRHTPLWNLPPPCLQLNNENTSGRPNNNITSNTLCLDPRYMARDQWSSSTSNHIVGINFCYLMMREEFARKRARRSAVFHHGASLLVAPGIEAVSYEHDGDGDGSGAEGEATPKLHNNKNDNKGEDDVKTLRQVLAISAQLEEHTEHVFGLQSTSPTGGIELVRGNQGSHQKLRTTTGRSDSFQYENDDDDDTNNEVIHASGLHLLAETPTRNTIKSDDSDSCRSSVGSCSSAQVADMNWVDISAKIGMRVLNSAHLQRVVASQEAAERIKGITEQFVVSPREQNNGSKNNKGRSMPFDFASPGEKSIHALVGRSGASNKGKLEAESKLTQSMPRSSFNRPVHSMWTSAAAAGAVDDEENSSSSNDDVGWKESKSSEPGDVPSVPPRIIRTRHFPSTAPRNREQQQISVTPPRDMDSSGAPLLLEEFETSQLAEGSMTTHEEEAYEIIDQGRRTYESASADTDEIMSPSSNDTVNNRKKHNFANSRGDSHWNNLEGRVMHQRAALAPGIKIAAPMFPLQPGMRRVGHSNYQMATVVGSKRIFVEDNDPVSFSPVGYTNYKNCLSVTCKIDRSFLRNGEFAEMTFRVMDKWSSRYMPKHSKVPIGACVATTFGVGVVVGWRVENDCHVIRSLWQRRGAGAGHAYLNRDAIHGVVEAAIGFDVMTKCGSGKVVAYVNSGRKFLDGRYVVTLQDDGVYKNCEVSLPRKDVYSCFGAQFIPVIEHIKEACDYQVMLDMYNSSLQRDQSSGEEAESEEEKLWKFWSANLDILWNSFLKAVDEDSEFDEGVDNFMGSIIDFLERLDRPSPPANGECLPQDSLNDSTNAAAGNSFNDDTSTAASTCAGNSMLHEDHENDAGFWIVNDFFGGIFSAPGGKKATDTSSDADTNKAMGSVGNKKGDERDQKNPLDHYYKRAFAVINTLMRTVSLSRASADNPRFKLALTICREFLMFVRTLIKVQQRNVSPQSILVWKTSLEEIKSTFGPIKERLEKVGGGIARRMEQQGRKAKVKVLRFADAILLDENFLQSLCRGEWEQCLLRIEDSLVKSKIIDEASCGHYRKTVRFIYEHLVLLSSKESSAAERNNDKMQKLAKLVQLIASPKRSFLKLLRSDDVLEILERILVRVFCREKAVSRMLSIHASNFKSLRHLRLLKDLSVAGTLWIPLLDAADEEFSYVVSKLPDNAKEFMCPLSSIFSLCVAQFHKIAAGLSAKDWLDFLLEEDGVRIISDLDMKAIQAVSSFSRDVKDMMVILPYYPSIDDDILQLMDEVELDKFLREASEAIDDADKLSDFIRENLSTAIERFLAYLPKLSIPVERRELGDGWVLSCHGEHGGDLTLSDVKVKRENLECEIMGGDALFLPMFGDDNGDDKSATGSAASVTSVSDCSASSNRVEEESILDHVREMILQAQRTGNWTVGIGGVGQPPSDQYVASVLNGLPITSVLNCGIDLWRNLEIDDDELLEIAIRDVSYQIQLHKEMEESGIELPNTDDSLRLTGSSFSHLHNSFSGSASFEDVRSRFNPRVDPTVLNLRIQNLTLHLERFNFRIEKNAERRTVFDPVFEGSGTVSIKNLSIVLRVECARERIGNIGSSLEAPVLLLRELDVQIGDVSVKLHDTGADWLLNRAVKGFSESITSIVETNLREQIEEQTKAAIEQMNSYFLARPDILLSLLGITMDDLEEHIVFV